VHVIFFRRQEICAQPKAFRLYILISVKAMMLGDSTIGKTLGKPRYKSLTTTRNLRTLAKVLR
jgi:hypothetical protein